MLDAIDGETRAFRRKRPVRLTVITPQYLASAPINYQQRCAGRGVCDAGDRRIKCALQISASSHAEVRPEDGVVGDGGIQKHPRGRSASPRCDRRICRSISEVGAVAAATVSAFRRQFASTVALITAAPSATAATRPLGKPRVQYSMMSMLPGDPSPVCLLRPSRPPPPAAVCPAVKGRRTECDGESGVVCVGAPTTKVAVPSSCPLSL
jgi:hypothetical protein